MSWALCYCAGKASVFVLPESNTQQIGVTRENRGVVKPRLVQMMMLTITWFVILLFSVWEVKAHVSAECPEVLLKTPATI